MNINSATLYQPIFGVIIPLPEESISFKKMLSNQKNIHVSGINYITGIINGKNIVLVVSGLGKINSSIIASRLIRDFQPSLVLLFGSSGNINPDIKKGTVVIGKNVINADLGELTELGVKFQFSEYLKNPQTSTDLPLEFNLDDELINFMTSLSKNHFPEIILGKIATSDALPNHATQIKTLHKLGVDVVEMEGAAVMQACWMFDTQCIVVRGVSNDAQESFTQQDINLAADNATKTVIDIIEVFTQEFAPVLRDMKSFVEKP